MNFMNQEQNDYELMYKIATDKMPKRLKVLRELFNYSQEYVADCLNLSQSGYGNLERGKNVITLDKIKEFAKIFKISVNDLFEFDLTKIPNLIYNVFISI